MINKNNFLYLLIISLIIILIVREGCHSSTGNKLLKDVLNYKTDAKHYKGINGVDVAQNNTLMLDNQDHIKTLLAKNDTLAKLMKAYSQLKSVYITKNITVIRGDSIAYDTLRIPCDFKPFTVFRDSAHYQFYGTIAPAYFKIDSLKIPDNQTIVFGLRKMGFLKAREYTAEVVHSNPLVKTTNIGSYAIKEKRKKIVISVGGGYGLNLTTFKPSPQIGVYIGYPILTW